jgi:RNA polymerase sigma factor FliA
VSKLTDIGRWGHVNADVVRELWQQYQGSRDTGLRAQLIEHYLPFARMLAAKTYANRSQIELEFADYLQYASIGLVEAVDRYDPVFNAKFETFASLRITGAILNGVVSLTEKQEQISARKAILLERVKSLKLEKSDVKNADAVFEHLAGLAIGLAVGFALEGTGMYQPDEESYVDNSYRRIELKQLYKSIAASMEYLPENERRIIKLHYQQQLTFDKIADMLGLTKGRISQIHKSALTRLRDTFGKSLNVQL